MSRPLLHGKDQLQDSFELTSVGIAHVGLDGKMLLLNQKLSDMTGYPVDELLALTLQDITYPADFNIDQDTVQKLLEGEINTFTMEKRYIRKDQSILWVNTSVNLVRKPDGTPLYLYSIIEDIKESRVASDKLLNTSRLLDSIIENVPNMIFLKHASDLRFEFFNCAGETLLGLDRSKLLGYNDYDLFPKDQADFFTSKDREVLEQHGVVDIPEEVIETPHGTRILHTQKTTLRDEQGRPKYLLGISEDITARKRAEQKLRQFKSALDQTLDCVFMFDADNLRFIYVNEGALNQVGYTSEELLLMHPYDIKPDYLESEFRTLIEPMLNGAEVSLNIETIHQHKNGQRLPVEIFLQYIASEDEPSRFVAIVRDITERKRSEAELDKYRHHLEALVEERTTDLAAARDEAERANAAKSDFLSRMSHELRTPMNAILGFGQLLKLDAGGLNKTQHGEVKEILDAGHHLLSLINEVLDLAKIESGKLEISMEEIPFDDLLQQCITLIQSQAESQQVELIDHISGKGYIVRADFIRLKQVLVNLLSNAVKYNCHHGRITLNGEIIGEQGLRILITDTGEGLEEEEIAKLFTPFERLNAVNNVEGTGIGLVITKHLIELMGGTIGVESTPGEGSTFWVNLELSNCEK